MATKETVPQSWVKGLANLEPVELKGIQLGHAFYRSFPASTTGQIGQLIACKPENFKGCALVPVFEGTDLDEALTELVKQYSALKEGDK